MVYNSPLHLILSVVDFQTSALRFSDSGVVEVRWRASSDQLFNVHVNNEGSEGFTDVSVQCGGSEQRACKAYYTMLKANMAYKAEVQKDIVAVSTAVPATTGKASMNPKKINEYFIIYVFICTNFWAEVQVKKGPFRTLIHALVPEIFNIGNIKRFL